MQRQRHCYYHLQVLTKLMPSVFEDIDLQKRKIKTLRRISPLTFFLLTYLVGSNSNHPPPIKAKPAKKTKTTKEFLGAVGSKNRIAVMILLQQVSISFSRKKRRTSCTLNTSTTEKKIITLTNIFRTKIRSQKTSVSLGKLYANNCS